MARFGLLYLRGGNWQGTQILSEAWIQESTVAYSWVTPEMGYGYMWWIHTEERFQKLGMYYARGYGGHAIDVFPKANLVVVHRVNTDEPGTRVSSSDRFELLDKILRARTSKPKAHPRLVALP